jgi:hypothetical protein
MTGLVPTNTGQQQALLELRGEHIHCLECGADAYIAFFIEHETWCLASRLITQAITNLPADIQAHRKEMEAVLRGDDLLENYLWRKQRQDGLHRRTRKTSGGDSGLRHSWI